MAVNIIIGALLLFGTVTGFMCAAPYGGAAQDRTDRRRKKYIAQNPHRVTSNDILGMLVDEGVSRERGRDIVAKAQQSGVKPFTMWLWLQQFDAEVLGVVVAADLTHRELLTHISNGTVPDLDALRAFAKERGLTVAGRRVELRRTHIPVHRTAHFSAARPVTHGRNEAPQVFEPGAWDDVRATEAGTTSVAGATAATTAA